MTQRVITSLGAATILGSVLIATVPRVSARVPSQFPLAGDDGNKQTAVNPCLPPNPNAVTSAASSPQVSRGRSVVRRRPIPPGARNGAMAFARTELFFGTDKPEAQ